MFITDSIDNINMYLEKLESFANYTKIPIVFDSVTTPFEFKVNFRCHNYYGIIVTEETIDIFYPMLQKYYNEYDCLLIDISGRKVKLFL